MSRVNSTTSWFAGKSTFMATAAAALMLTAGQAVAQQAVPRPGTSAVGEDRREGDLNDEGVRVSEYLTVDIFVNDEDLNNVLQMLSVQSQKNIVVSQDVSARVSANFYGVTIPEALDALLNINGYGWIEKGNFIYVYTLEELEAIKAAARKRESRVIRLNYLSASDAAEFVEPLLSAGGKLVFNEAATEFSLSEDVPSGAEDYALESTLIVNDYPEHLDEIQALITSIDTRPSQVLVEATILQTQLNEANAFGVEFAVLNDLSFTDFFDFGGPLGSALALTGRGENKVAPVDQTASAFVSSPGNIAGPATFRASVIADDVAVFLKLLDEVTDITILSNPKILTLNRQASRVLVGRKLGYLNTTSTETATTQTVEFLDTGTQLTVRPFVSNDGMIRLELQPRVSEGQIRETTDGLGAAVTIPDEVTQELSTNIIVPDGATVVLGGLFRESTSLGLRQVPILGDIPIIGAAFRGHDDATERAEIVFMITPTIVNDQILLDQGERAVEMSDRIRTGTRQGLLPWSQDRQTKQQNILAERAARDGNLDKANWHLRRSLELRPAQPDAIQMREELFNKADYWPSRSMLESIVDPERYDEVFRNRSGQDPWAAAKAAPNVSTWVDGQEVAPVENYDQPQSFNKMDKPANQAVDSGKPSWWKGDKAPTASMHKAPSQPNTQQPVAQGTVHEPQWGTINQPAPTTAQNDWAQLDPTVTTNPAPMPTQQTAQFTPINADMAKLMSQIQNESEGPFSGALRTMDLQQPNTDWANQQAWAGYDSMQPSLKQTPWAFEVFNLGPMAQMPSIWRFPTTALPNSTYSQVGSDD